MRDQQDHLKKVVLLEMENNWSALNWVEHPDIS
jgi:hypothetical protein